MFKHESGQLLAGERKARLGKKEDEVIRHARIALGIAVAMSLVLALVPRVWPALAWLAWPQLLVATLAHELGHGFAALLAGGGFDSLKIYADGSGVATTRIAGGGLQRAFIAAGGPFGPPLVALMLFVVARHARSARIALVLVALVLAFAALWWARNGFGFGWVVLCAVAAGLVAWRALPVTVQAFTCFLAVQLCLASVAGLDYLFSRGAVTGAGEFASDTQQIAAHLGGPHWLWGGLIALASLGVMVAGLWFFLRALHPQMEEPSSR